MARISRDLDDPAAPAPVGSTTTPAARRGRPPGEAAGHDSTSRRHAGRSAGDGGGTASQAFRVALGIIALFVVDDAFAHPEPGTEPSDHIASGLVPLACHRVYFAAAGAPKAR